MNVTGLKYLIDESLPLISNLSNASSFLNMEMEDINWCGFYIAKDNVLYLGPFQGEVACTKIPFSKGICGRCATLKETVIVDNVLLDKAHIACSSKSRSEIVVPIIKSGEVKAVIDIDSPSFSRFNEEDKKNLEIVSEIISKLF